VKTIDINEAKANPSQSVDRAADGEPFVIAKADKPLVEAVALRLGEASGMKQRGFMAGQIVIPDDFDRMGSGEIALLFCSGA
jgi:antitoxin (DNA-binding transcriptional repressor) of toxin-antitoxin stability system